MRRRRGQKAVAPCHRDPSLLQCEDCQRFPTATVSERKKKLRCHRTSRRQGCDCQVCVSLPALQIEATNQEGSRPKRVRRASSIRISHGAGEYREDGQVVDADRKAAYRDKQSKRRKSPDKKQQESAIPDSPGKFVGYLIRLCRCVITLCQQLIPRHPQA